MKLAKEFVLTDHAQREISRRELNEKLVISCIENPEQVVEGEYKRVIHQIKYQDTDKNQYILRTIIDVKSNPKKVITVYKTSKIQKYWPEETDES